MTEQSNSDYYRKREQVERDAARSATCDAARRAHEELANFYADLQKRA